MNCQISAVDVVKVVVCPLATHLKCSKHKEDVASCYVPFISPVSVPVCLVQQNSLCMCSRPFLVFSSPHQPEILVRAQSISIL
jgi:hypothetical protein